MPPERRDPFAGLNVASRPYQELNLGLILSENAKNAMRYGHEYAQSKGLAARGRLHELADKLFEDIARLLQKHFRSVVTIGMVDDAKAKGSDLVAVLDVFADYPASGLGDPKIEIITLFLTPDGTQIESVRLEAVAKVQHMNLGSSCPLCDAIQAASIDVVRKLENSIGVSVKLAEFNRFRAATAAAVTPHIGPALSAPVSDVDILPSSKARPNRHSYAVIIGIEQYREKLPKADFADRDARLMGEYLTKVLGYPEENVVVRTNEKAARTDLEKYVEGWLPNNVEKESSVFIYYSGHGAPNPKTGEAYLVPYDGDPTFVDKTGYPVKRLYAALDKLPAKEITVVLDSCFSGAGGRSVLAKGAKPMVLSVENAVVAGGKTVVLAANSGDQISSAYQEKGHGLLTYFFLKGLQGDGDLNKDGVIDMAELYEYVKPNVQRIARKQYNNEQTPQLLASPELLRKGGRRLIESSPR